ncbi:MAG: hypothetical protein SV422_11205 [Pseudomonadota bacterium]|nr:hypothetical protein [Pseudomonadota bacterium]
MILRHARLHDDRLLDQRQRLAEFAALAVQVAEAVQRGVVVGIQFQHFAPRSHRLFGAALRRELLRLRHELVDRFRILRLFFQRRGALRELCRRIQRHCVFVQLHGLLVLSRKLHGQAHLREDFGACCRGHGHLFRLRAGLDRQPDALQQLQGLEVFAAAVQQHRHTHQRACVVRMLFQDASVDFPGALPVELVHGLAGRVELLL